MIFLTISLGLFAWYAGLFVGSRMYFNYIEPTILDDKIALENKHLRQLVQQLEMVIAGEIAIEHSGQLKWITEESAPEYVKVPYNVQKNGSLEQYLQFWRMVDWKNHLNPDMIWIERTEHRRKGDFKKKMWIHVEDYDSYTDEILNYVELNEDYIVSNLPCQWEYKGCVA